MKRQLQAMTQQNSPSGMRPTWCPKFFGGKRYEKNVGLWRMDETSRDGMLWRPQFFMVFWAVFDELSTRLDHIDPAVSNYVVQ